MSSTDSRLQLVVAAKNLAMPEINRLHGGLVKLKGGLGGLQTGAARAGGAMVGFAKVGVFGVIGALGAAAGAIGFATKQAAGEQVGIVRLNAALKANVKGYNGRTDAIEKVIAVNEKLGFSDDEQRKALALLLPLTHNVAKAQGLISESMDVSRARGIDLASATVIVRKAYEGNVGALKKLGIVVTPVTTAMDKLHATVKHATPDQIKAAKAADTQATATRALGQLQKASAGQAQAYGDTQVGIFESIKITLGDVVEDLGGIFLPALKTVSLFARDTVVPALSLVVTTVGAWTTANAPLIAQVAAFVAGALKDVIAGVVAFGGVVVRAIPTIMKIGKTVYDFVVPKIQALVGTLAGPGGVIDSVGGVVGPILKDLLPAFGGIVTALFGGSKGGGLIPAIGDLVGVLWGGGNGPLAVALRLTGTVLSTIASWVGIVIGKLTDLVKWITGNKPLMEVLTTVANGIAGAFGLAKDAVQFLIDKLGVLAKWVVDHASMLGALGRLASGQGIDVNAFTTGLGNGRARGGPIVGGGLYRVGENGSAESYMLATGGGYVIPDGGAAARRSSSSGGGSGQVIHTHVYLNGREIALAVGRADYYELANQAPMLSRA
jgi:hypothetical protein